MEYLLSEFPLCICKGFAKYGFIGKNACRCLTDKLDNMSENTSDICVSCGIEKCLYGNAYALFCRGCCPRIRNVVPCIECKCYLELNQVAMCRACYAFVDERIKKERILRSLLEVNGIQYKLWNDKVVEKIGRAHV